MDDSEKKLFEIALLLFISKKVIDAIPDKTWNQLLENLKRKKVVKK